MTIIASFCLVVLVVALFPCFYRMVIASHTLDRLVAFDLVAVLISLSLVVFAIIRQEWAYLDIAMSLAVLGFVGTVAGAHYVERAGRADDED
jgi:multicomponent Na+:H+ antiporter subunit F